MRLKNKTTFSFLVALLVFAAAARAAQPRQTYDSNDNELFVLKNHTRPAVLRGIARDEGRTQAWPDVRRLSVHFAMSAAQRQDMEQLLQAQQQRGSAQYHQFLTPEQFAARFGASTADIRNVTQWLESRGFQGLQAARSRRWISFSGTSAQAEEAFNVSLHRYSLHGQTYFANAADPRLPKVLAGVIESVGGLHSFQMKSHLRHERPQFTSSISGNHYLAPDDWATIYGVQPLYGAGLDGSGVTIAVVGQSDVLLSDIQAFRAAAGLPANDPTFVVPPGSKDPGIKTKNGDDEGESDLDIEWTGAIARNAHILFITASSITGNGVEDSIAYAIDNKVAPILSSSYGLCEGDETQSDFQYLNSLFAQANAQGMTIVAASGDSGAVGCDTATTETVATRGFSVDFPASSPYVTGVGGTTFNDSGGAYWSSTNNAYQGSALSYIPEQVWNDGFESASGGGASVLVPKPTWQVGPGVPADTARDVPDVAFAASPSHDGLIVCGHGSCVNGFRAANSNIDVIGGTSAAGPAFAGVLALLLQMHGSSVGVGNINPNIYVLAQTSPQVFNDIVLGNNQAPCRAGTPDCATSGQIGFIATPGYDQTTGWGSLKADEMVRLWFEDIQLSASPAALTVAPGASAVSTVTVSAQNNFTGDVTFTCSVAASLPDVTCSVPASSVNTSGTTAVTITAARASAPLLKWFRLPPAAGGWVLLLLLMAGTAVLFGTARPSNLYRPSVYAVGSAFILVIALGAVSCGGGGSSGSSGPVSAPPLLTISCTFPSSSMLGVAYNGSCTAGGGTGALTFSISAGALPVGVTLNSVTGSITGTPTAAGTDTFTVKVSDSGSPVQTASQSDTGLVVAPQALSLACTIGTSLTVGVPFSGGCTAAGGTSPVTYSISAGTLPAGLTLSASTGAITGSPTTAAISGPITLTATDSGSPVQTASQTTASFIVEPSGPLTLVCYASPVAQLAAPFNGACAVNNAIMPYSFTISNGPLPPGLTFNASTGALTGTPTAEGSYPFTVQVTDSSSPVRTATQSVNLSVGPETGLVTVTATSGGIVKTVVIAVTVQ